MDTCISILPTQVDSHAPGKDKLHPDPKDYSDPETRELAEILRRLERLMPSRASLDWSEARRWNIEALQELSQTDGKTDRLIDLLDGVEFEVGGDEYILFRERHSPKTPFEYCSYHCLQMPVIRTPELLTKPQP